jgi:peptidoglycan/LPS O-acetylase OafA/YrhL
MNTQNQRIEYLDSLRGLAALIVLLSHALGAFAWPASYFNFINLPLVNIVFDGKAAVAMFFVLSGFVLSRPYVHSNHGQRRQIFLPTFYIKRGIRIWLPWFSAFLASAIAQHFVCRNVVTEPKVSDWLNQFWQSPLNWMLVWHQCLFILHDSHIQLLNQDWSLGVELKGSALIPIFIFLISGWRLAALGTLALALFFALPIGSYYIAFILGALMARYSDWLFAKCARLAIPSGFLFISGLCLSQARHIGSDLLERREHDNLWWLITSVGCSLVLLGVLENTRLQRCLNHRLLVFFGQISYSVYLLQFIVIICLLPPFVCLLNSCGLHEKMLLFPLTLLVGVLCTVLISAVHFQAVEKSCIDLGRLVATALQSRLLKNKQS